MQGRPQVTEIRVRSNVPKKTDQDGKHMDGWHWHPDSPGNRQMLQVIVESCNEIYGDGTHWVEVRDVELVAQ